MALSIKNTSFWDLWLMKLLRNFASVKYQCLLLLYCPTIWGMFHTNSTTKLPWITATEGLTFLSGTFITLAASRVISRGSSSCASDTPTSEDFNTDK